MIHHVVVGVALSRPPATHQIRRYAIEAPGVVDARLAALQMASATSVMPVWASSLFDYEDEGWDDYVGD